MKVHYRELGSGPPLLLVHGLMTASYSWRYVAPKLAETYRVIVPDLPGAGASDKVVGKTYSLDALGTWVGDAAARIVTHGGLSSDLAHELQAQIEAAS